MCRSAPQFGCALNGQGERLLAIARAMNGIAVSCQQGGEQMEAGERVIGDDDRASGCHRPAPVSVAGADGACTTGSVRSSSASTSLISNGLVK